MIPHENIIANPIGNEVYTRRSNENNDTKKEVDGLDENNVDANNELVERVIT